MSVTISFAGESLELTRLQAQPFGYEGNSIDGLTYRAWNVTGHVMTEDWLKLLSIYESWRLLRFEEQATRVTRDVGTTVSFSGKSFGLEWTNVECWFSEPPSLDGEGFTWLSAGFAVIDAAGYLAVQEREEEQEGEQDSDAVADNGKWRVECEASDEETELTLLENPDGWAVGPELSRTAVGSVIVQGPLDAIENKRINGYTDEAGWQVVRCWYEDITSRFPIQGEWYPSSPPAMSRSVIRKDGADVTRCTITYELWKVA